MYAQSTSRGKRRNCDSSDDYLADEIKKVRLSLSPGEIRFQRDLRDFDGSNVAVFSSCDDSMSRLMTLYDIPDDCPSCFVVQINRHYPHKPPVVKCLQHGYFNEYISQDGIINHSELQENWLAVYSLSNVFQIVRDISLLFHQASNWQPGCNDHTESMEETPSL
jgi:ubiquitin-protein ligase